MTNLTEYRLSTLKCFRWRLIYIDTQEKKIVDVSSIVPRIYTLFLFISISSSVLRFLDIFLCWCRCCFLMFGRVDRWFKFWCVSSASPLVDRHAARIELPQICKKIASLFKRSAMMISRVRRPFVLDTDTEGEKKNCDEFWLSPKRFIILHRSEWDKVTSADDDDGVAEVDVEEISLFTIKIN